LPGRYSVDDSIEHVEAARSAIQAGFVEVLDVEARTQCGFGALARLYPHGVADLVAAACAGVAQYRSTSA